MTSDTQITYLIAHDVGLRLRVEATIRRRLANHTVTATEAKQLAHPPIEDLAWKAAGNASILASIKEALDDGTNVTLETVATAVADGLTDNDLEYVIYNELTCLRD